MSNSEKDYKDTLNLPVTDFPMRANLAKREPGFLEFWREHDIYHKAVNARKEGERFVLHDGPPYANGNIHNTIDALPNQNYSDFITANQCFDGTSLNDWSSSMLTRYISIPVTFGFRVDEFELGFTALPALAINTRHCGLRHELDTRNTEYQNVTDISNSLAPYKIDLRIDMRFYHVGIFLQVATSPLFQSSNQNLYPIKFGFIIK